MENKILLGHGSGGRLMHGLIRDLLLKYLSNPCLDKLTDAATIKFADKDLAFTTDSFVVKPLFFPGADIGKLAICGTINDLVMMGARPMYISCGIIVAEGFDTKTLEKITQSLSRAARQTKVKVVTGDFKVVEKGSCDGIFINTSGVGEILKGLDLSVDNIKFGDKIIINGSIGEHGIAVLSKRHELDFKFNVKSDCAALNSLVLPLLKKSNKSIRFMRDPTRGGLATSLNEIIQSKNLGIIVEEKDIPVSANVKAACEILGLDPLYIANEGKVLMIAARHKADEILTKMKKHPLGKRARIIGEVIKSARKVYLKTISGGTRVVDMLTSEPLPRIC